MPELVGELRDLLDLASGSAPVTRDVVLGHLEQRAVASTTSGPNLQHPAWADRTGGASDAFLELGGAVAGARVSQPHYGQYVDLFTTGGSPADVESVVGPLQPLVKVHYDDPDRSIAYVTVGGQSLRVIVETPRGREGMVVTVHFPS